MSRKLEAILAKIGPGDYVVVIKPGVFSDQTIAAGSRGRVLNIVRGFGSRAMKNKSYALVDIQNDDGETTARIRIPVWWLRPRNVLDDLADIDACD